MAFLINKRCYRGHNLIWLSLVVMGTVIFLEFERVHTLELALAKLQSNMDLAQSHVLETVQGLHRQISDIQAAVDQLQNSEIVNHANLHNVAQTHPAVNIKPKVDTESWLDKLKVWIGEPVKPVIPFGEIVP